MKNTSEWTFGPEYVFSLTINDDFIPMWSFLSGLPDNRVQFLMLKCRPKMTDSLFCELQTFETFNEQKALVINTLTTFEMKFNNYGVEKILTNSSDFSKEFLMIKKIVTHLSTGVDVQRNFRGSSMRGTQSVKHHIDKCDLNYRTTYSEPDVNVAKQNTDFQFVILPMFDVKPNSTFVNHYSLSCDYYVRSRSFQVCIYFFVYLQFYRYRKETNS